MRTLKLLQYCRRFADFEVLDVVTWIFCAVGVLSEPVLSISTSVNINSVEGGELVRSGKAAKNPDHY